MSKEKRTQWHSGFYTAVMLELKDDKDILQFEKEHTLNTKPIVVDMLVIKKQSNVTLHSEIGRIFKEHNLMEYKSPQDEMGVDEYFKTYAYASLYKSMAATSNGIICEDITLTMVRDSYPLKLMKWFETHRCSITQPYDGIYYVSNAGFFQTQIIVSSQLSRENHIWLKGLTNHLQAAEADRLLIMSEQLRNNKEEYEWAQSVLQVAYEQNETVFHSLKEGNEMTSVLMELMKPEVDKMLQEKEEQVTEQVTERITEKVNELNLRLWDDNRMDDLKRSMKDTAYQKQLMEEYGI